jgi:hypothetical protein
VPREGPLEGLLVPAAWRARRTQPKAARGAPMLRHELLDQGTLAEPRFSGQEYELAGSRACFLEAPVQCFELLLTLEQMHDRTIIRQ